MTRLDAELVARGLARSRGHARDLIAHDAVRVSGRLAGKAALPVSATDDIVVSLPPSGAGSVLDATWVSRAAGKLLGAFADLPGGGPQVRGRRAADVGASTGGFTQVLLARGARHVFAIDVGHGQLAEQVRADPRVSDLPGLNVRDLTPEQIDGEVDLVVVDLSFISLTLVLDRLAAITRPDGDLLVLIKPQFEVGRAGLDGRGVVRPGAWRRNALTAVLRAAVDHGLSLHGLVVSRTPGQDGNTEFIAWLRHTTDLGNADLSHEGLGIADREVTAPAETRRLQTWDSVSEQIDQVLTGSGTDEGGAR